jgi:ABC-2 type transport system ATP-binding protein
MRRRLNIACGILHAPRVVLLDEPTVGVDPQSRDRIYDVLADLARSGVSLLLTTHHLEEAEARCSRTVIIDHGRVIAAGTLAELVEQTVGPVSAGDSSPRRAGAGRLGSGLRVNGEEITVDAADARIVKARMRDVAADLPPLLERIRRGRAIG